LFQQSQYTLLLLQPLAIEIATLDRIPKVIILLPLRLEDIAMMFGNPFAGANPGRLVLCELLNRRLQHTLCKREVVDCPEAQNVVALRQ
jgi:hypothetical protein